MSLKQIHKYEYLGGNVGVLVSDGETIRVRIYCYAPDPGTQVRAMQTQIQFHQ